MSQHAPFMVQVEFTEGCNLMCSFCGIHGIRDRVEYKFMTQETVDAIIREISEAGWTPRFLFAMHGEPTLNPKCLSYIKQFRKSFSKSTLHLMTNGVRIGSIARINQLKNTGLNDLIIDSYSEEDDAAKIKSVLRDAEVPFQEFRPGIPQFCADAKKDMRIIFNPPIQQSTTLNQKLCNHCGCAAPLNHDYDNKRCTVPFRELSIRFDGNIALCCNDFRGVYPIGNINENNIVTLWNSPRFHAARVLLYNKERCFAPCYGCDAVSMRVGLLPDPLGQDTLPLPDNALRHLVMNISKNNIPFTKAIKREWEL